MSLQKSTSWFALGTLLSRISGLVRVSLVLSIFGASKSLDAFFVAFRIPNLFRDMLAEGALSNAFTKMYADCFEQSEEKAKEFFAESICLVLLAGFCVMLTGVLTAPLLVKLMTFYGEPDPEFVATATVLTRILFPFLYLMMLGSIFAGTLHHKGRFFLSSLAPLGFNFGYILGAIAFAPFFSWLFNKQTNGSVESLFGFDAAIVGLAVGVLLGGAIQTFLYAYKIWHSHIRPAIKERKLRLSPEVKKAIWIGIPVALASVAGPINQLVNTNYATSLESGAITWLESAFRLFQLPIGLFGVSVGVVVLPKLTRSIHQSNQSIGSEAKEITASSINLILELLTPCFLMLFILNEDICRILFGWGNFSPADVTQTGLALKAYAGGIFGYGLIKVLMSVYYAIGRTRFTLIAAGICVLLNAFINYHLVGIFGHQGLAATSSIVLSIQALLLVGGLYATGIFEGFGAKMSIGTLAVKAIVVCACFLLFCSFGGNSFLHSFLRVLLCGIFCSSVFWGKHIRTILKRP